MSLDQASTFSTDRQGADATELPREARSIPSRKTWWAVVMYIAAAALAVRMIELDLKPLHHDEGVNAFFLTRLVRPPHFYRYNPSNFHGPTLYYFAWASTAVFGLTDFALRFVPAVFGLLTIALILPIRRQLGEVGSLAACVLLALSPGAVFNSRYFIHESILACCTLGLVVASQRYGCSRQAAWLLLAALFAAGMTATKETWIISAGVLVCAAIGTAIRCRWVASRPAASQRRALLQLGVLVAALAVFIGLNLLFYTSLFKNWDGAVDAVRSLAFWANTGQADHRQPWFTYLGWLAREDLPLFLLGLSGAALALWRGNDRFAVFTAWWAVGIITAYSLIPYKTPWLTLNFLPPLALSAAYTVDSFAGAASGAWRRMGFVAAGVVALAMTYQTVVINFVRYDDDRYAYVYAQTNRELLSLVKEVGALIGRETHPVQVVVMSPEQFPLSWY